MGDDGVSIANLFLQNAAKTPSKKAIVFEDETLTYEELAVKVGICVQNLRSIGVKEGEELRKTAWLYSVRIMADESYPDAHKAGRAAEDVGIWRFAPLGRAMVYTANIKEYFDFVCEKLESDRWFLARGPAGDVVEIERKRAASGYVYKNFGEFDLVSWLSVMQNPHDSL